jgi:pantoate--beta-alanine ligase
MEILTSKAEMKLWSGRQRMMGKSIGFVPTMGYLHEGHLSLIRRSRAENDSSVVSLFVNPTQFGPHEDLAQYPRDIPSDTRMCADLGVEVLFMPDASEMYGPDCHTFVNVEKISESLCGASRPGHFRGVATVVLKLFNIVSPSAAYFGQKDYQQLQVIKTLVRDLDLDVKIVPCETVREKDGLAMSSRNSYLSPRERKQAICLYEALQAARQLYQAGEQDADAYRRIMRDRIALEPDAVVDYVSLVDPETLVELDRVRDRGLAALAVRIGKTRLIDNMVLEDQTGTGSAR